MDYYGLFPKFKLNRPLDKREIENKLNQKVPIAISVDELDCDLKIISVNSNYLELVDKFYSSKGFLSLISSIFTIFFSFIILFMFFYSIFKLDYSNELLLFNLLILSTGGGTVIFSIYALKKEWFAYTHYPILFDRKQQLVHAHRIDGSVLTVPWKEVFFTNGLCYSKSMKDTYYISGHVLAKDNTTVVDTFCLPATSFSRTELLNHWEFVRRYMEEGPESIIQQVTFCLPIEREKESYWFNFFYLLTNFSGKSIILLPISLPLTLIFSIPRYIAILTSRRPIWPEQIQAQCQIKKDDPYLFNASMNPKSLWGTFFQKKS